MDFEDSGLSHYQNEKLSAAASPTDVSSGAQTPVAVQSPPAGEHSRRHPHVNHARERLRHLIHPDGRKIHIAHTPEEHVKLQKELSQQLGGDQFDVVISGSPEHLAIVRELHAHHAARRDTLRDTHGDIFHDFEQVRNDLDNLSQELSQLTHHGVAMDANFSKFGYTARIRTKDDHSGTSTPMGSLPGSTQDLLDTQQSRLTDGLKFFKRPVIRQYFHKGLLWRSSRSGEVGTFELFADLLYVGIIGIIGDKAAEDPTGKSFLLYAINFTMAFKIWNDLTLVANWFERDDIVQKLSVMLYLILLFAYTTNISYAFEDRHPGADHDTYYPMMSFYLAERFYGAFYFIWLSYVVPLIRGTLLYTSSIILLAIVFWLASIHANYPGQLAFIWVAILIDLWGQGLGMFLSRASFKMAHHDKPGRLERFVRKNFEFYPAINIEHRTERTNAFVSLVFGYSVLTILYQSRASVGLNAFLGKGILGLIQAFAFQWLYFEIDHHGVHVHAIRRHWLSSTVWITCHLPFVLSYVLAAATLSKLVIAHDCANANVEELGESYQVKSVGELDQGLRWYYCAGIASALMTMTLLSYCHVHKRLQNPRLSKGPRLVIRTTIALAILLLPLAKDKLSSLSLIGISTALVSLTLAMDIFGMSSQGDRFWTGGWCEDSKRSTHYEARIRCSRRKKRDIIKALHRGETVRLDELLRRQRTNSSAMSSTTELGFSEDHVTKDEEWQHAAL
ncbi:hypothetical protein G647_02776 [Cladophialophora carrionii CBS 160.54]|uniref:Uncharacterized protein n=1 Tax=Cladophialophora carrionii CBS 160.54 TaxID=1279043 RepID=V9DGI4_9EURO|nr:uncharacterized protein G647_02776 [Cladophialophora carrionii CBS 160.54]ETI25999.1 hypothetical protein G647_02776 [Cladophialophora carrionii CBS 160.54]